MLEKPAKPQPNTGTVKINKKFYLMSKIWVEDPKNLFDLNYFLK